MEELEKKPKKNILLKLFIILLVIGIVLYIIARYVSTSGLIIKEYAIIDDQLPTSFHGLKIVHFSDIHYTFPVDKEDITYIVEEINKLKPDIVVYTGDIFPEYKLNDQELNDLIEMFNNIEATLNKYAISGNHDYEYNNYQELIESTDFIYMDELREDIYYQGEEPISIYGFASSIKEEVNYELLNDENPNYKIVLTHEPDNIDNFIHTNPNLVLAGHSHGGQVRIPFIGATYLPNGSRKYYEEYYKVENADLYISSGIGNSVLPIRFLNKPSINLYRLYNH